MSLLMAVPFKALHQVAHVRLIVAYRTKTLFAVLPNGQVVEVEQFVGFDNGVLAHDKTDGMAILSIFTSLQEPSIPTNTTCHCSFRLIFTNIAKEVRFAAFREIAKFMCSFLATCTFNQSGN